MTVDHAAISSGKISSDCGPDTPDSKRNPSAKDNPSFFTWREISFQ